MIKTIITSLLMLCSLGISSQIRLRPIGIIDMVQRQNVLFDNIDPRAECQYIYVSDKDSIPSVFYVHIDDSCNVKEKYKLSVKLSDNTERTMISDKQTVARLRALFRSSVNSATFRSVNEYGELAFPPCYVFDGLNGACCEPLGPGGDLGRLLDKLVDAVKKNSKKELDCLLPAVDSLRGFYRSLYPEDYFHIVQQNSYSVVDGKTTVSYRLITCNGQISFCFAVSPEKIAANQDFLSKLYDKYAPFIKSLVRDLFHKSTALDLYHVCIIIDDNLTRSARVTSNEATFVIHEADVTEEIIRNIIIRNLDE